MSRSSRSSRSSRKSQELQELGDSGKTYVLQVKVTPDQKETIRRTAKRLGLRMATWARQVLLRELAAAAPQRRATRG